jgi:hypothetical protein
MQHKAIDFDLKPQDFKLVGEIADRAEWLASKAGIHVIDRFGMIMDISACHCNGCPLDLSALRNAPDFDFVHDVWGISRHLDRATGTLQDCFSPRFAL